MGSRVSQFNFRGRCASKAVPAGSLDCRGRESNVLQDGSWGRNDGVRKHMLKPDGQARKEVSRDTKQSEKH